MRLTNDLGKIDEPSNNRTADCCFVLIIEKKAKIVTHRKGTVTCSQM